MIVTALVRHRHAAAGATAASHAAASPVADVVVTPASGSDPGDTLRFRAEARDSAGRPMANVKLLFRAAGGRFEGSVDSSGLVKAGSTGTIPVTVIALVNRDQAVHQAHGSAHRPGPAARIVVTPRVTRLVTGQRLRLSGSVTSEDGDARQDTVAWRSSNRAVVRVDANGLVTAVGAGSASVTAAAGTVTERVPSPSSRIRSRGSRSCRRAPRSGKGDVIQFTARPLTAAGREITGLTPSWSFSPGEGMITDEGNFVGYETGDYVVTRASAHAPPRFP